MKRILLLLVVTLTLPFLQAEIGATQDQCISRYGKPERNGLKESGLLYFRKEPLCIIAHFYQGRCDVLSIFSSVENGGVAEGLSDEKISTLLKTEGSQTVMDWVPVSHLSMNGVWNASDNSAFAIYDTMRNKLVIMTRAAYKREKEALATSRGAR